MKEKSPAFQFYPGDFLADANVQMMTMAERGIYITLICHCWRERHLPNDMELLARLAGVSKAEFEASWPVIGRCFRRDKKGRLIQPRLRREFLSQLKRKKMKKEAGSRGGKKTQELRGLRSTCLAERQANSSSSSSSSSSSATPKEGVAEMNSAELVADAPTAAPKSDIQLPLNTGKNFQPLEAEVAEWEKLYLGVDVMFELRRMRGWLLSNPKRRKTARGIRGFITSWLSRAQDKSASNGHYPARASPGAVNLEERKAQLDEAVARLEAKERARKEQAKT